MADASKNTFCVFQSCSSPFYALLCCRQYHQEIEDFVFNLVHKYEEQQRDEQEKTHFNLKPQVLEGFYW